MQKKGLNLQLIESYEQIIKSSHKEWVLFDDIRKREPYLLHFVLLMKETSHIDKNKDAWFYTFF